MIQVPEMYISEPYCVYLRKRQGFFNSKHYQKYSLYRIYILKVKNILIAELHKTDLDILAVSGGKTLCFVGKVLKSGLDISKWKFISNN